MSGSGTGGGLTSHEIDLLRKEARERLEQSRKDAHINAYLQQLLNDYNSRDVEATNDHLDNIEEALGGETEFDRLLFGGSVSKQTHVEGLSDVDSLVVFEDARMLERPAAEAIDSLRSNLEQRLPRGEIAKIESGDLAVTVTYRDGAEIQLLPALRAGDRVAIPAMHGNSWAYIAPRQFAQRLTEANRNQGGAVIPTIKLAKALLATQLRHNPLSGYHVEALAIAAFRDYNGPRTPHAMLLRLVDTASEGVMRRMRDVTGQSSYIDEYLGQLESAGRRAVAGNLKRVSNQLSTRSVSGWKLLFGDRGDSP